MSLHIKIHAKAIIDDEATVGKGTCAWAVAHVQMGVNVFELLQ